MSVFVGHHNKELTYLPTLCGGEVMIPDSACVDYYESVIDLITVI